MNKTALSCILAFALIITIACGIPVSHPDPFYSAWEEWGVARFPLIKPYEVYFSVGLDWWTIDLDFGIQYRRSAEMKFYLGIDDVQEIAVEKGVIMIYTPYEQNNSDLQKVLYWFVIIPGKTEDTNDDILRGFDKESDFLEFIKEYEIENVTWESPEDIKRRFVATGCLDWIPECD